MWNFLQATEVTAMLATGRTGTCTCYRVEESMRDASTDGTHLKEKEKEKGLHICVHPKIFSLFASNCSISRAKRRHNNAYRNLSGKSSGVDPEAVED
jgi:hypothetical protein